MTRPWQSFTPKGLNGITHKVRARIGHRFIAPRPLRKLSFTRAQLCASMAITNALSGLSPVAAKSLAQAMAQLVTDHVDDDPPVSLQFQHSIGHLADSARAFLASCIGTGFADQYTLAL